MKDVSARVGTVSHHTGPKTRGVRRTVAPRTLTMDIIDLLDSDDEDDSALFDRKPAFVKKEKASEQKYPPESNDDAMMIVMTPMGSANFQAIPLRSFPLVSGQKVELLRSVSVYNALSKAPRDDLTEDERCRRKISRTRSSLWKDRTKPLTHSLPREIHSV